MPHSQRAPRFAGFPYGLRGRRPLRASLALAPLHDEGDGLTAADAKARESSLLVLPFEGVEKRRQNASPRSADWVSERDGTTIRIHFGAIEPELLLVGERHDAEGFVDLPEIDVRNLERHLRERLFDRQRRRSGEPLGRLRGA